MKLTTIILILSVIQIVSSLNIYRGHVGRENDDDEFSGLSGVNVTLVSSFNGVAVFNSTTVDNGFFFIRILNDEIFFNQILERNGYNTRENEIQIFDDNDRNWVLTSDSNDLLLVVIILTSFFVFVTCAGLCCGLMFISAEVLQESYSRPNRSNESVELPEKKQKREESSSSSSSSSSNTFSSTTDSDSEKKEELMNDNAETMGVPQPDTMQEVETDGPPSYEQLNMKNPYQI